MSARFSTGNAPPPCPLPPATLREEASSYLDVGEVARSGPLAMLRAARALRESLDRYDQALVAAARDEATPWRDIARALGMTSSGAHKRYRHVERRPRASGRGTAKSSE
jgi:type IV secretory pathway VirD2 relaxase